jgi:hypothetical protein
MAKIECPQCKATNEDDVKNCKRCRVNLYWAFQHYEELATIQQANELVAHPETPSFLIETSKRIDEGPIIGWLRNTIKKVGLKGAGKKVCTMTDPF